MRQALEPPVVRYLDELELALKQHAGVAPEEALSDAREHLEADWRSLHDRDPGLGDTAIYEHFVAEFGSPQDVARGFAEPEERSASFAGHAPGWRIRCTRCGRSAPAARIGIWRIGARSWSKYLPGWCRGCRRVRWLRLTRDLERPTLARKLGVETTPEQLRRGLDHPWRVVLLILATVAVVSWLVL